MYLVHIHLKVHPDAVPLPESVAEAITACAIPADRLEHAHVYPDLLRYPVVAVFSLSASLLAAETSARDLWHRTVDKHPHLSAWAFDRAQVPLMLPEDLW